MGIVTPSSQVAKNKASRTNADFRHSALSHKAFGFFLINKQCHYIFSRFRKFKYTALSLAYQANAWQGHGKRATTSDHWPRCWLLDETRIARSPFQPQDQYRPLGHVPLALRMRRAHCL
jgi:hypothetical protein